MIQIESLKDYLNKDEFLYLAYKIYNLTSSISNYYQNYEIWYWTKQIPRINSEKRNILFIRNPNNKNEIIAISCLKKDEKERKICTLYVKDEYRNQGFGSLIIEESFKWLETTKPLITIPEYKLNEFIPIIEKYHWNLTEIIEGLYHPVYKELFFNNINSKNKTLKK